jgi:hypothetical protein
LVNSESADIETAKKIIQKLISENIQKVNASVKSGQRVGDDVIFIET